MKSEKHTSSKVSLDDLFALKRAERPSEEFWQDFQRDFHVRQRAEAIEPKRWWFVLPRVFAGFSRYQMPMGAAAVLAVTFLSFRDYREPGFEVAYSTPQVTAPSVPERVPDLPVMVDVSPEVVAIDSTHELETLAVQEAQVAEAVAQPSAEPVELSPMVVWAGPAGHVADLKPVTPTPSQQSIAANLASAEAEQVQVGRLLGMPEVDLAAVISKSESLNQVTVPEPTRKRLFVYQGSGAEFNSGFERESGRDTHSLIANRISNDELYESVSRVTAGGDHLTLKF